MTKTCSRCGDAISSESDKEYIGCKEGSALFQDEKEYEQLAMICTNCRFELEEWLGGKNFEDVKITFTVKK